MTIKIYKYHTEDGDEAVVALPVKMTVCPECEGYGTVLREGLRHTAFTLEEFEDTFFDDEDREAYFQRGGKYDVECPECRGRNVVLVVNEDSLTETQKAAYVLIRKGGEDEAADRAADAATRRMESGGY